MRVFALLWLHPEADRETFAQVLAKVVLSAQDRSE